jgi:DNA-binding CsgD family transcriptional regulator
VVAQLLVRTGGHPLDGLTQRERDVLALMAEGRSNTEIGAALVVTESAVSKHINSIFAKLELYPGDVGHRRVLAVLRYLGVNPLQSLPWPCVSLGLAFRPCVSGAWRRPFAGGALRLVSGAFRAIGHGGPDAIAIQIVMSRSRVFAARRHHLPLG